MSCSNRELVEFFISNKLSQGNHPTSLLWPEDAVGRPEGDQANPSARNGSLVNCGQPGSPSFPDADLEAVKAALRDSAVEFEQRFAQVFGDLSWHEEITPGTDYHIFKIVMDELFCDGVNWGRVVGLFVFGGVLCMVCVERDRSELVPRVADYMTTYLDEHISPWIQSQGGWDTFAAAKRPRWSLASWLLAAMVALMGVVVGVVFIQKR